MPIGRLLGIGKCHTSRVNTLNLLRVAKALKTVQCALLRAKSAQNIGQYKEEPNWPDPGHQKKKKNWPSSSQTRNWGSTTPYWARGEERISPRILGKTEREESSIVLGYMHSTQKYALQLHPRLWAPHWPCSVTAAAAASTLCFLVSGRNALLSSKYGQRA